MRYTIVNPYATAPEPGAQLRAVAWNDGLADGFAALRSDDAIAAAIAAWEPLARGGWAHYKSSRAITTALTAAAEVAEIEQRMLADARSDAWAEGFTMALTVFVSDVAVEEDKTAMDLFSQTKTNGAGSEEYMRVALAAVEQAHRHDSPSA